jgi:predicted ATP-grasp superfamily ATP-dependent carboligase
MNYESNSDTDLPIAFLYEHPEWFNPLFAELDRRGVAYERLLAHEHHFDPAERAVPYSLVVNRMSPSAFTRGHASAIFYTRDYLAHLDATGANVVNGYEAYAYEISKARQLTLFRRLGVRYPRSRVISHPLQAEIAARGLTFPVVVKPNVGGSGAGIVRFDTAEELASASLDERPDLGVDGTALVQEYLPARDNSIVRVEVLNGEFLYAIRLTLQADVFNLCPADYCRVPDDDSIGATTVPVEGYVPPTWVIEDVKRMTSAAGIEVGGVEYLVNDRDGEVYYYDMNALSNFVADAPNVVGFDPFPRLVDFLKERAGVRQAALGRA